MRCRRYGEAFFADDRLAELSPLTRIFFLGLLACADREGRLEDRPRKLKALILPFDDADGEAMLADLALVGVLRRYEVHGHQLIAVLGFREDGCVAYQRPHPNESASVLPPPPECSPEDLQGDLSGSAKVLPRGDTVTVTVTDTPRSTTDHEDPVVPGSPEAGSPAASASKARRSREADLPPEALQLAQLLADLIRQRDPHAKVNPKRWATDLEKLYRLDGREWQEIERILRWSQQSVFWRANVLSGGKLREQFTTLTAKADEGRGLTHQARQSADELPDIAALMAQEPSHD